MLRRLFATLFSISILLSVMVYPASANEESFQPEFSDFGEEGFFEAEFDGFDEEPFEINPEAIFVGDTEYQAIDLSTNTDGEETEYSVIGQSNPISQSLDFSNMVSLDLELTENQPSVVDLPENQPPVANPEMIILNPESMRDGKYTTATRFLIITRWNSTDLCYDPEGGPLYLVTAKDFPLGYVKYVKDLEENTWAGFQVCIFNEGYYPFAFAFADEYGGISQTFSLDLEIIRRGVFESFEGVVPSSGSVNREITVDYSAASEYCITFLRTGTLAFNAKVLNPDGTTYGATYVDGGGSSQDIKRSITLSKPDGITGTYTYTVEITGSGAAYKVAYGESSQRFYFLEDVSDSVDLPYYHSVRDLIANTTAARYVSRSALSDYGDYYKIVATGTERVTLSSSYGKYNFRILDGTSLQTLYDSSNLGIYHPKNGSYYKAVSLNFEEGTTYYVVVYDPDETASYGAYTIAVGDPIIDYSAYTYDIPARYFTKGQTYEWSFEVSTPTGMPAYIRSVNFTGSDATWSYENNGYYSVLSPGASSWRTNARNNSTITYNYKDENAPFVNAVGEWRVRITAGKTGNWPGRPIVVHYCFGI